jgi:hypothetical protein
VRLEGLGKLKKSTSSGTRTGDHPACSIVPQPTTLPRASYGILVLTNQMYIQGASGGKVNILGGHSIGHSKQKSAYVHVSYSERFPR